MDISQARIIMGGNFIGPDELKKISRTINLPDPYILRARIPEIPFTDDFLKKNSKDYILILGLPRTKDGAKLTVNSLRSFFGLEPQKKEPCFYNQDWYLKEKFAKDVSLKFKWYLIKKNVLKESKGKSSDDIDNILNQNHSFPSAVLAAFTFFSFYLLNKKILWKNDFIWCSDKDKNGDRVYVGRYIDPKKVNKNGFNIHRHLSIRPCFGLAPQII